MRRLDLAPAVAPPLALVVAFVGVVGGVGVDVVVDAAGMTRMAVNW